MYPQLKTSPEAITRPLKSRYSSCKSPKMDPASVYLTLLPVQRIQAVWKAQEMPGAQPPRCTPALTGVPSELVPLALEVATDSRWRLF